MLRVIISVALFMLLFIYLTLMNPHSVRVALYRGYAFDVPVSVLIMVCLAIGFVVAYLAGIMKDIAILRLKSSLRSQSRAKDKLFNTFFVRDTFSFQGARRYLESVRTGKDPHLLALYGRLLRETGELAQAKELHSELKNRSYEGLFIGEFLMDLLSEGRHNEVLSIVKDLDRDDRVPSVLYAGIEAALALGEYSVALGFAEDLHRIAPSPQTEAMLLGIRCEELASEGDTKGILKLLKKRPGFVPAVSCLVELGEMPKAVDALRTAYKKDKDPTYLFWLVDLVVKKEGGDPKRIMDFMVKVLSEDDPLSPVIKAYLFVELGMYEDAVKVLGEVELETPLSRYVKALALRGLGKHEESSRILSDLAKSGVFKYRCHVCGAVYDSIQKRCSRCKNYGSVRLEV